ncbi:hypothetical protein L9F63_004049, partial [Diploptera punctata]
VWNVMVFLRLSLVFSWFLITGETMKQQIAYSLLYSLVSILSHYLRENKYT